MKILRLFCLSALPVFLLAQTAAKKTSPPTPADTTIPAGAVKTEDGGFKFTDAKGKKWLYRQTPFGVSKTEDKPIEAPPKETAKPTVLAYDEGDTVRFESPTPFGTSVWRKKKSELDATEQKIPLQNKSNNQ